MVHGRQAFESLLSGLRGNSQRVNALSAQLHRLIRSRESAAQEALASVRSEAEAESLQAANRMEEAVSELSQQLLVTGEQVRIMLVHSSVLTLL